LPALGWTVELEAAFVALEQAGLRVGRIAIDFGAALGVLTAVGAERVGLTPDMCRQDRSGERPVVGDWVALAGEPGSAVVVERLARTSTLTRRRAGSKRPQREQVIAANVDTVFLVTDARDFSPRRVERSLAIAREAPARPVIVLTKLDACPDVLDLVAVLRALAPDVAVHPVSSKTGAGLDELDCYLQPGRTICLIGSSGVGKSTLANRLLRTDHLRTGEVHRNGAGRHTTTRRELVCLPGGGILIDNPGMREVGLWAAEDGVRETFEDVVSLAEGCRFVDCRHDREPGCAVRAAVDDGELGQERLTSFRELTFDFGGDR
jgi:ribosome biogenesis GTPase / thiamine phosphate phosphatase